MESRVILGELNRALYLCRQVTIAGDFLGSSPGGGALIGKGKAGRERHKVMTQHAEPKGEGVACYGNRRHRVPLTVLKLKGLS